MTSDYQRRFKKLITDHQRLFSPSKGSEVLLFSSPGRTELGGNHTDHNHGRVLAAAIQLDTIAAVTPREDNMVHFFSEGYPEVSIDISSTAYLPEEEGKSDAIIRGIADYFRKKGICANGFQANTSSQVLKGSGLSSSAAVEILIGTIFQELYAGTHRLSAAELALAGQYAENKYFGKPCGLMDQLASSFGGVIAIDFLDPSQPKIDTLEADFQSMGYSLCVVNTGGDHADLTCDYASVPEEMKKAAAVFGRSALRGITREMLIEQEQAVRAAAGDRAWLRALHFVDDDIRALQQVEALRKEDMHSYLHLVNESGNSSSCLLQNTFSPAHPEKQGISVGLVLTKMFLDSRGLSGAYRVHGGGFAGTIQSYIPAASENEYRRFMESVFGRGAVTPLRIRNHPAGLVSRKLLS